MTDCLGCISHDRQELLSPHVRTRVSRLALYAIALMRAYPVPEGLYGDDVDPGDAFEIYAGQLEGERDLLFRLFEDIAWQSCDQVIDGVPDGELLLLAAYCDEFSDRWSRMDSAQLRDQFDPREVLRDALIAKLDNAAVNLR